MYSKLPSMRYTSTMRTICQVVVLLALAYASPNTVQAVSLYLDAPTRVGDADTFYVPVRIDPQGSCINAARVVVAYDPSVLSVQDITTGDSLLTLWTVYPEIERDHMREVGRIVLEGGIPGGYCGRVEGDPGLTNLLARLVVTSVQRVVEQDEERVAHLIVDPETEVIEHDGEGTVAPLTVRGADVMIVPATTTPSNPWLIDVRNDTIAPELFDITLVEGPSEGSAKHYIAFSTVDKQSGIDHYEILETDPDRFGILTWVQREAYWVRGESPYVLRDQKLRSKILVKAVDKAGNERVVEYTPPLSLIDTLARPVVLIPFLVLAAVILLILGYVMHRRRRGGTARGENSIDYDHDA